MKIDEECKIYIKSNNPILEYLIDDNLVTIEIK